MKANECHISLTGSEMRVELGQELIEFIGHREQCRVFIGENLNTEDCLVQKTFADVLRDDLGWDSVYAWTQAVLGRSHKREVAV